MANTTGKGQFKPGQSGNSAGRPKLNPATKRQKQLQAAQKATTEELQRNISMYKAIRDGDAKMLKEFGIDPESLSVRAKMDASKEINKLALQYQKELEGLTEDEFEKMKNSGVVTGRFYTSVGQANKAEKNLRVV